MQKLKYINGNDVEIDLTDGVKYGITNWAGLSECSQNIQTQQVPFSDGAVFLDNLLEPRELSFTLAIQDSKNLTNRYTYKRELITALNPKLGEGYLVYTNDYLSRRIKVIPDLPIFENKNFDDAGTLKAELVFTANEPYWEDVNETSVNITAGEYTTINNNGDVPVQVEIDVQTENVDTFQVYSKTEDKKIKFTETMKNNFVINTNVGQKQINKSKRVWGISYRNYSGTGVCYSNEKDLFVIIGENGTILTSPDGSNWTSQIGIINSTLQGITYANNQFIVVGNGIITSPDGINWTKIMSLNYYLYSITYGNNLFVAVGGSGKILTSTDGITWTQRTSGTSAKLDSVIYVQNKFIAVGYSGTILTSSDGITWTSQTSGVSTELYSITYGNGLFVVVGENGTILTSSDGITWTSQTSGVSGYLFSIIYKNNLYVAVGSGEVILTSIDGITWTSRFSGTTESLYSVTYGTNQFVVVGNNGIIRTSLNGINWTYQSGNYAVSPRMITQINNLYILVGTYSAILISSDSITWNLKYSSGDTLFSITYGNNLYVAVGSSSSGGKILTSPDTINWTQQSSGFSEYSILHSVTYGNGLFITVGYNKLILISSDGISWIHISDISNNLYSITYGNNLFVAVGENGTILTSTDGITWTQRTSGVSFTLNSVTYGNGLFVAVGAGLVILTSLDGITWNSQSSGVTVALNSIIYSESLDLFIIAGAGIYLLSKDGITWTLENKNNSTESYFIFPISYERFLLSDGVGLQYSSFAKDKINLISELSADSDMTLGLDKGANKIRMTYSDGTATATIKYRQKYIGV